MTHRPWTTVELPAAVTSVRTMLSDEERQYLTWLTAERYEGWGAIVELGVFLGSSSVALAEGLRRRGLPSVIRSFDLFRWEEYMAAAVSADLSPGDDFLPLYLRETSAYASQIDARKVDLMSCAWDGGPIEILFVDSAKTWELTNAILSVFGPHLVPGRSRVVLQDFRYHFAHCLPLIFDSRPDVWKQVEDVAIGSTVTFMPLKPLFGPGGITADYSEDCFPLESADHLLKSRISREEPAVAQQLKAALYRKYLIDGPMDEARRLREELLAGGFDEPDMGVLEDIEYILHPRGFTALEQGDFAAARAVAERCLAIPGRRTVYSLNLLGFALMRSGERASAERAFDEILTMAPGFPSALLARAELAIGDGRYEDGAAGANAVLEARPADEITIQWAKNLFAHASTQTTHDRGWSLRLVGGNRAGINYLDDPKRIRIELLEVASSANYDVQLNRVAYPVSAGGSYRLTFSARADAPRDICVGFSRSAAPWSSLGFYQRLTLTTDWVEYTQDFVATADDDRGRVHFDLADAVSAVELRAFLFWKVTGTGAVVVSRSPLRLQRAEIPGGTPDARVSTARIPDEPAPAATRDDSWVVSLPNPRGARTLPEFRMFAVLGTWMEADVVTATIRNATVQGCERVYLIDNGSTDDTVDVARREGAIVARTFRTDRYDETLRLRHMNDVVTEVSQLEADQHIWWLFLDADEFPHGPWGLTVREYLATLDQQFRIVGTRFFNHYPSGAPHYEPGRHPLDFQPLCEELAFPMCPSGHRKHPLQRFDRGGTPIECGNGFHGAVCSEQLFEPSQPAFLHHFPFRDEGLTRRRLEALWATADNGVSRALESHDTHMLTRFRSLDAVYSQDWAKVENFVALDPVNTTVKAPASGVNPRPWFEMVDPEHQPIARWYSPRMIGAWKYEQFDKFHYGDDVTYEKGMAFLDGHGTIEDWGCGFGHARQFVRQSRYVGVDGSAKSADTIADLREYASDADCIFMRHVLEHNVDWKPILENAVASFRRRMALIIFTPFSDSTRVIRTTATVTSVPVPDISFRKADLTEHFANLKYSEEAVETDTEYGLEHVFYIEK